MELKKLKSLRTVKGRRATHLFMAEGVRLLEAALRFDALPQSIYCAPEQLTGRGTELLAEFRSARVPCEELKPHELESLADTETPQGILAIFKCPDSVLPRAYRPEHSRVIVCDGVSDPGNLGTLIRSALAFGFELMILTGSCADPLAPKVVRASVGAIFGIRVARAPLKRLLSFLDEERFHLVATSADGSTDRERLQAAAASKRLALAIGAENEGLSAEITKRCALNWQISHREEVESLNAAVAGSIVMREVDEAVRGLDATDEGGRDR